MSLIIALDFQTKEEVTSFLQYFGEERLYLKVGMELFYREGPAIVTYLKERGHWIFLDLKLHDIPNTVRSAMKSIASLGVDMVNVHAAGGTAMMKAAMEGLNVPNRPLCMAVTQLTSTSEAAMKREQLIGKSLQETVLHYAKLAEESGLDGVVCSPLEVPQLRLSCRADFQTVTPGIRRQIDDVHDQVRVTTPHEARRLGTNFIVVGRSITKANNPYEAYKIVKEEWEA